MNSDTRTTPKWLLLLRDSRTQGRITDSWLKSVLEDPDASYRENRGQLEGLCTRILEPLSDAMGPPPWSVGSLDFRDTVKAVSVAGGRLAETNTPVSFISLFFHHMERALTGQLDFPYKKELSHLMACLAGSATEAYHLTSKQREAEAYQEFLRKSTPLVFIREDIPVLFLLGTPEQSVLIELLDRLYVSAIQRNVGHLLVDFTGVSTSGASILQLGKGILDLASRSQMETRTVHIVSAGREIDIALKKEGIDDVRFPRHDELENCLENIS